MEEKKVEKNNVNLNYEKRIQKLTRQKRETLFFFKKNIQHYIKYFADVVARGHIRSCS